MNTCSRVETTGEKNRIHISHETAELLTAHGKAHWCRKREDSVSAKGKGVLSTYWLEVKGESAQSTHSSSQDTDRDGDGPEEAVSTRLDDVCLSRVVTNEGMSSDMLDRIQRLVKWNADLLARKLCTVVARREARNVKSAPRTLMMKFEQDILQRRTMVLDEVKEVITLPAFDANDETVETEEVPVDLGPAVSEQLYSYLMTIALLYRENSFHCFEHATHVTMSVVKLLSRVVEEGQRRERVGGGNAPGALEEDVRCHAYGITSDPLTQFAMVYAALIHDVDHKGVPNAQLAKENDPVAAAYQNRSPAEQNSIDIAWSLLMKDEYQDLRAAIYATPDELVRFRQLVVNAVMATDIMDKDLGLARKARWNKAFSEAPTVVSAETTNRKATIVLEHLIQASDVAHTMQHWNIYRKWNARFFEESYKAYLEGRAGSNPADAWYDGELGFFDYYIIPLAMKLKDCGVFGVSSDEYLNYAQQNRREWESRGRELVEEMVQTAQLTFRGEGEQSSRLAI
jgi:3'5'-cyclic nucleotide phosphodiesterase/Adenylate and Guanylate cyclase catalytic domain